MSEEWRAEAKKIADWRIYGRGDAALFAEIEKRIASALAAADKNGDQRGFERGYAEAREAAAKEVDALAARVHQSLHARHTDEHEATWGADQRECKHPACSADVRALAGYFGRMDAAIDRALTPTRKEG